MRYRHLLSEQQLDELRMSPSSLRNFGASDAAKGIMAGFEAELVFTGLGESNDDDYDMEPDMDADERCRSIDQILNFFQNDDWGYGLGDRAAERLQQGLDEMYMEWSDERMHFAFRDERDELIKEAWLRERPMVERVHDVLVDGMNMDDREADRIQAVGDAAPKFNSSREAGAYIEQNPDYKTYVLAVEDAETILEEDVETTISKEDGFYDEVLDEFRENFYLDDDSDFFDAVGLRYLSDVQDQFELMWPIMTSTGSSDEGGFSEENANKLAETLSAELGVETKVSTGYHSAKRDDVTWIFEPDSSLDADDSDNMPVEVVSPPMPLEECLSQMEKFFIWAESNGAYTNSSTGFHMGVSLPNRGGEVDYVKLALFLGDEYVLKEFGRSSNRFCSAAIQKIKDRLKGNKEVISGAIEVMRHNLLELAQKSLEINNHGFGKYTSINPQGGISSNDPSKQRGAKYIEFRSAGGTNYFEDIDKLKNTLLRYAQAMTIAADPAAERREYYKKLYKLISPPEGDPALDLFSQFAAGEISSEQLKKSWADKALSSDATATGQEQSWEVYNVDTGDTLEIVTGKNRGEVADQVYDKYADQKIGFNVRAYQDPATLTPRAKLAKRIKAPKQNQAQLTNNSPTDQYEIVDRRNSSVLLRYRADDAADAADKYSNWLRNQGMPQDTENYGWRAQQAVNDIPITVDQSAPQDATDVPRNWEFVNRINGQVVHNMTNASYNQANVVQANLESRYPDADIYLRSVSNLEENFAKTNSYSFTSKKLKEWEDIVDNMITPVGRLGQ